LLCLLQSPAGVLTANQVFSWRSFYSQPLDKDVSQTLKVFGEPSIVNGVTQQWNPSPQTQMRTVFVETTPSKLVLRITVYPRADEAVPVMDVLHFPEKFIFSSGVKPKFGSYFLAETKDRGMGLMFLCAPDHDPQLGYVTFNNTKSPDPDVK